MRYPEFLKPGGTIGFVAPSMGCSTEPYISGFNNALRKFKDMGYETVLGPNCYKNEGIGISSTPLACGDELNKAYVSEESDAIISCGGGEMMCEVVPYIDFEAIGKAKPKWYMGYSDNTNFTFLSATLSDTAAVYGPCAGTFGMEPWHEALEDAFRVLTGERDKISGYEKWEKTPFKDANNPYAPYNLTEDRNIISYVGERRADSGEEITFSGRLVGGCMDCLGNLVGTKFDRVKDFNDRYKNDGIIWFMEACDLNVFSIRRTVWQLKNAGWFDRVNGFLIGRPLCHGSEMFGLDHIQAAIDLLSEYNVPVVMDLDIGHLNPMMPVICGGSADISVKDNNITIEYTWK